MIWKTRVWVTSAMLCFAAATWAQQSERGFVQDAVTHEPLSEATVTFLGSGKIISTSADGFFNWESDSTQVNVQVTYQGYAPTRTLLIKHTPNIISLREDETLLSEEVLIRATRATDHMPMAQTTVGRAALREQNFAQDMPLLLNWTPSIVTTSDAGNGVGYTGMRIRGSDPSRINVTINGVPLNDSEEQGVFWVDVPDVSSSTQSVQIQRGVGTSSNGAGAFGASVNVLTGMAQDKPSLQVTNAGGSYGTHRHMVAASTGIHQGFSAEGRLSLVQSDGYIDRARSDLRSYFMAGSYIRKDYIIKVLAFSGKERTFQSWYGVPESRLNKDEEAMKITAAASGFNDAQLRHLLASDSRRYNVYTYPNQVDDYEQQHQQIHFSKQFNDKNMFTISLHHTYGAGYFEEFKYNDKFEYYHLPPVIIGGQSISSSDLVRQRWLKNHFYGIVFSHEYKLHRATLTGGGSLNRYIGDHYGLLTWARIAPSEKDYQYYFNRGDKFDGSLYAKLQQPMFGRLFLFLDLQGRYLKYRANGSDHRRQVNIDKTYAFFNPKAGLTYQFAPGMEIYFSFAVGHRDPVRSDYINSAAGTSPAPERLYDWEGGYRWKRKNANLSVNGYYMRYKNQLILTGKVNDIAEALRVNVPESYRLGLEVEGNWHFAKAWQWNANISLSRNKIKNFTEVIYDYGADGSRYDEIDIAHVNTDIAYSPSVIVGSALRYQIARWLSVAWMSKYVGKQYLDNTMQEDRIIRRYWVNDLRLEGSWQLGRLKELSVGLLLNNFLNEKYVSNGYRWGYLAGAKCVCQNFYFPQAPINFMGMVGLRF